MEDYEIIDGIKVAKSMPENQKDAIRKDDNSGESIIPEDFFKKRDCKIRVTMFLDADIVDAAKKEAKRIAEKEGKKGKYQTLINNILRGVLIDKNSLAQPTTDNNELERTIEKVVNEKIEEKIEELKNTKNKIA